MVQFAHHKMCRRHFPHAFSPMAFVVRSSVPLPLLLLLLLTMFSTNMLLINCYSPPECGYGSDYDKTQVHDAGGPQTHHVPPPPPPSDNPKTVDEEERRGGDRSDTKFINLPDNPFGALVKKIRELFNKNEVNTEKIRQTLEEYKSDPNDWEKYVQFNKHEYTRNLVDKGNGKYNLMILCWGPGMGSSIHDHSDANCFVKVLKGQLLETQFAWPVAGKERGGEEEGKENREREEEKEHREEGEHQRPMQTIETKLFNMDGVSHINDDIGLHRMENPSHDNQTVTLHLYIPAYDQCHSFDQLTGKKQQCKVKFHSKYGQKTDYGCGERKTAIQTDEEKGFKDSCSSAPLKAVIHAKNFAAVANRVASNPGADVNMISFEGL